MGEDLKIKLPTTLSGAEFMAVPPEAPRGCPIALKEEISRLGTSQISTARWYL